ncbi:MAG: glycolate oxidase subunit GlcF [Dokdonella sp.]
MRPLLPAALREKIPLPQHAGTWPTRTHARRMILLAGCVQPAMQPNINAATARVFDALGVQLLIAPQAACCGAIRHHLDDLDGSRADARRNIDAWLPLLDQGAEAIVMNASGCGVQVKDYAHLLRDDPHYAEKALRIAAATRDVADLLPAFVTSLQALLKEPDPHQRIVFHAPCTLQHGQKLGGAVESLLGALGVAVLPVSESHLCCGSAGTYSVLQPELSRALRTRKLAHLEAPEPDLILSANIGCISHLQAAAGTPVRHWIEWLDERLAAGVGSDSVELPAHSLE